MSNKLHDALRTLAPRDFNDVPLNDLSNFLTQTFTEASTIVDSVPQPPGGSPSSSTRPQCTTPNSATKASEIISSPARLQSSADSEALAEKWGKPLKIGAKDNPLNVSVWKMAGHDRNGAWFARRSVHEGLGFAKWKKAMMREFPESLETEGSPGEGSVRGIGADRRIERKVVEGVGKMEVYQLAAQFPAPTAPREFITMLLTTDKKFSESSNSGRQYTVVSIPVNHPDAPPRSGLVRGKYESVEVIREIPLNSQKSKSTSDLSGSGTKSSSHSGRDRSHTIAGEKADEQDDEDDEAELNPVEWIMITRSDPGGGIPRFLVDRGTPSSITADAAKFVDWACSKEHFAEEDKLDQNPDTTSKPGMNEGVQATAQTEMEESAPALPPRHDRIDSANDPHKSLTSAYEEHPPPQGGMLSNLISSYAPSVVQQYLHPDSNENAARGGADGNNDDESDTTETSSLSSFASAEEFNTAEEGPAPGAIAAGSSSIALHSPGSSTSLTPSEMNGKPTQQDKELAKLAEKKEKLDAKLAKAKEKDEAAKVKAQQKYERDLAKLEAKREKEKRKLDEKRKKQADKDAVSALQRERDEWRQHASMVQKENQLLREQVKELQRENTLMAARLGKTEEGKTALALVKEDLKRDRARSVGSTSSGRSGRRSREVSEK